MEDIRKLKEHIVCRKIDDEMVLVPLVGNVADMNTIYTLNDVAAFIWEHIDTHNNKTSLAQTIVQEYDIQLETALNDINDFFSDLKITFSQTF